MKLVSCVTAASQPAITCSELIIETLEKCANFKQI